MRPSVVLLLGFTVAVRAAPFSSDLDVRSTLPPDAPFTQASTVYEQAITCPNGIQGKAGGIVFLVHGTGSTGAESWANGPYNVFLPTKGKGYDICWIDLPHRSMANIQLSAEYVAYGIPYLAKQSAASGNKISIISHSQGGVDVQWALAFWPSTRQYVSNFIPISSPFLGTVESNLLCVVEVLIGCQPALFQQSALSRLLIAANSKKDTNSPAQALVPTTSVWTVTDEIVEPEFIPYASSSLPGASNIAIQGVCGPLYIVDHFVIIIDPAAFGLAFTALETGQPATAATFNKSFCNPFQDQVLSNFQNIPPLLKAAFDSSAEFVIAPRVLTEPLLQPYVCARGYATASQCGPAGFLNNYD